MVEVACSARVDPKLLGEEAAVLADGPGEAEFVCASKNPAKKSTNKAVEDDLISTVRR